MKRFPLNFLLLMAAMLMVLHPYTLYGKPGVIIALLFAVQSLRDGESLDFFRRFVLPCILLLCIAIWGTVSSVFHGIPQFNHPAAVIAFIIMVLGARGFYLCCVKAGIGLDGLLKMLLASIVFNSAIVLLEIQFDAFRQAIEMHLDPLTDGTINYAVGYRLRGVASSGGAALSLAIPAAVAIGLHLYDRGKLSLLVLTGAAFVLLASVVVIGRSGIVLLAVPLLGYLVLLLSRMRDIGALVRKIAGVALVIAVVVPLFYQLILEFFTEMFGEAFVTYAFGFLLEGEDGIRDEGTVGYVAEFLTVLPLQFPEALTGFGFYGGSAFYPWTDSGFSRTFLSVGFILGMCFYAILLRMYLLGFSGHKYLIGSMVVLLVIAEAKEPLMYSGTAARMFILLAVFAYSARAHMLGKAQARLADTVSPVMGGV